MIDEAIKRMRRVVKRQEDLAANLDESLRELGQGYDDMRLVVAEIDSLRKRPARVTAENELLKRIERERWENAVKAFGPGARFGREA